MKLHNKLCHKLLPSTRLKSASAFKIFPLAHKKGKLSSNCHTRRMSNAQGGQANLTDMLKRKSKGEKSFLILIFIVNECDFSFTLSLDFSFGKSLFYENK